MAIYKHKPAQDFGLPRGINPARNDKKGNESPQARALGASVNSLYAKRVKMSECQDRAGSETTKSEEIVKNWNIYFLGAVLALLYFGGGYVEELKKGQMTLRDEILKFRAEAAAIGLKIGADEKEKASYYKLTKNQDVWAGTGCVQCHNTTALSLPINKISIAEAMRIVREGSEKSRAGGMPLYAARGTRDKNSITDADLKVRLDALYIKELLDYAKE